MTAQICEFIIFDTEETMIHSCPSIPEFHERIEHLSLEEIKEALEHKEEKKDKYILSTACWRKYIATWKIKKNFILA